MMRVLKAVLLMVFLFVLFGLTGGAAVLFLSLKYFQDTGRLSAQQIQHVRSVLEMQPDHFEEHVSTLLAKERQPIDKREEDLFAERKRLAQEWSKFNEERDLWLRQRKEETTRLRAEKLALSNERRQLDILRDDIKDREGKIEARENAIRSEGYEKWLNMLRKMQPAQIGSLLVTRTAGEIVQDLNQMKPQIGGQVVLYLQDYKDSLQDQQDREAFERKLNLIIELARDGGLKIPTKR